ncbi:MAG TPA: response regulator [Candidatus Nitrosotenuis sp.]|jgi:two-component system cell cycle sensor histidine kinase/response regulator CckA|nr:response regulator [Candidatus Nitrosotenuis sp.]
MTLSHRNPAPAILVVDDEEAVRRMAARALTARGYRVLTAASGEEALQVFDGQPSAIDVVLVDSLLPGMPGPELCRRLLALNPELAVVAVSGQAQDEVKEAYAASAVRHFLFKPYRLGELAEAVERALGQGS